ncbi:MAG: hypothetical protein ACI8P9_003883, partial [Parasphingorhabdus sp.]
PEHIGFNTLMAAYKLSGRRMKPSSCLTFLI